MYDPIIQSGVRMKDFYDRYVRIPDENDQLWEPDYVDDPCDDPGIYTFTEKQGD